MSALSELVDVVRGAVVEHTRERGRRPSTDADFRALAQRVNDATAGDEMVEVSIGMAWAASQAERGALDVMRLLLRGVLGNVDRDEVEVEVTIAWPPDVRTDVSSTTL